MVNIANFQTWYQNRTTVSAKRKPTDMRRHNKIWLLTWTLLVCIAHWLVATAAGCTKKGAFTDDACASTKSRRSVSQKIGGGACPDVACASTKSRCAVSKHSQHIKIGSEQSAISPSARFLRNSVQYSSTRVPRTCTYSSTAEEDAVFSAAGD